MQSFLRDLEDRKMTYSTVPGMDTCTSEFVRERASCSRQTQTSKQTETETTESESERERERGQA